MAEVSIPEPAKVEYDLVTGIPSEYNDYLPHDTPEYKRWRIALELGPDADLSKLNLTDSQGNEIEKALPGGKFKKKSQPNVVIEVATRSKRRSVTSVEGLDQFGVKLSEASKIFGKKFASGASVVKNQQNNQQIDIQGDFLDQVANYIVQQYKESNGVTEDTIYFIDGKTKTKYYNR